MVAPSGAVWADDDESSDDDEGYVQETVEDLFDAQVLGTVHQVGAVRGTPALNITDQASGLGVMVISQNPAVSQMITGGAICRGSVIEARGERSAPEVLGAQAITVIQKNC
jgi:hypothetical protein